MFRTRAYRICLKYNCKSFKNNLTFWITSQPLSKTISRHKYNDQLSYELKFYKTGLKALGESQTLSQLAALRFTFPTPHFLTIASQNGFQN